MLQQLSRRLGGAPPVVLLLTRRPSFTIRRRGAATRQIDAKPSVPQDSGARPRSKKIFVGGLAPETTPGAARRAAAH
jgi:hypothetical protein